MRPEDSGPFMESPFVCVLPAYVSLYHMCSVHRRQERMLGPPELELQMVVYHTWVLGIEPKTSERAACVTNHWAISPAPVTFFTTYLYILLYVIVLFIWESQ